MVHRLIYEWVYGSIPDDCVIDHIDANRSNNVPWNLQAITNRQNTTRNKTPASGHHHIVVMPSGKYRVQIKGLGPSKRFVTLTEAINHRDRLLELVKRPKQRVRKPLSEVSVVSDSSD